MEKERLYQEIGIFDLLFAMVRHKKMTLLITGCFFIIAFLVAFLIPQHWISKAALVPVMEPQASTAINLNIMEMLSGGIIATQKEEMATDFIAILDSRTFREGIIRRNNLINYFKIDDPDSLRAMDKALEKLADKVIRIHLEVETSVITISVETTDKLLSRNIAQDYLNSLEEYNQYTKLTKSKMMRQFLEQRVMESKAKLDSLTLEEKKFLLTHKAVDVDLQMQDIIKLYSDLATQKFQAEIDYELAAQIREQSSPELKELKNKIMTFNSKLKEVEQNNSDLFPRYMLTLDEVPDIKLIYSRLLLERTTAEQIYTIIYTQYEAARIDELKAMPTMEIIDKPNLAGLRAKPKRTLLITVSIFAGLLFSALLSFIVEFISPQQKYRVTQILKELGLAKKKC